MKETFQDSDFCWIFRFVCSLISVIGEALLYLSNLELEQLRMRGTAPQCGGLIGDTSWGDRMLRKGISIHSLCLCMFNSYLFMVIQVGV